MTDRPACSLWMFVARTDVAFMMQTIPHIVRMCDYPFVEKVLAIDVAEPSGEKRQRPHLADLSEIRERCAELLGDGVVDRVIDIEYSDSYRKKLYKKHFGLPRVKGTHNYKGYPVLGSMFCIEECRTDHMVHFDSDMLLYQKGGYDWISEGISQLDMDAELIWVRPQAGPEPGMFAEGGGEKINKVPAFASRAYLFDIRKLEEILPLTALWAKRQGKTKERVPRFVLNAYHRITGGGILDSWEKIMTRGLKEKERFGSWMYHGDDCWTLHPCDHGHDFIKALPEIIERVERGEYPPEQAGKYDLDLGVWLRFLGKQ